MIFNNYAKAPIAISARLHFTTLPTTNWVTASWLSAPSISAASANMEVRCLLPQHGLANDDKTIVATSIQVAHVITTAAILVLLERTRIASAHSIIVATGTARASSRVRLKSHGGSSDSLTLPDFDLDYSAEIYGAFMFTSLTCSRRP